MRIANFVGVRAGVAGKLAKALSVNIRSSADEAMLVLRMFEDVLQVMVFGKIGYTATTRRGENMRITAKGMNYPLSHSTSFFHEQ